MYYFKVVFLKFLELTGVIISEIYNYIKTFKVSGIYKNSDFILGFF